MISEEIRAFLGVRERRYGQGKKRGLKRTVTIIADVPGSHFPGLRDVSFQVLNSRMVAAYDFLPFRRLWHLSPRVGRLHPLVPACLGPVLMAHLAMSSDISTCFSADIR